MAAPTTAARVKKALANPEPSTHGPTLPGTEDGGSIRHGLLDELLRSKDRFRNHSMNAFGAVHGLCDMIVDGHARNHVGLLACEMRKSLRNEIDSFAHGDLH